MRRPGPGRRRRRRVLGGERTDRSERHSGLRTTPPSASSNQRPTPRRGAKFHAANDAGEMTPRRSYDLVLLVAVVASRPNSLRLARTRYHGLDSSTPVVCCSQIIDSTGYRARHRSTWSTSKRTARPTTSDPRATFVIIWLWFRLRFGLNYWLRLWFRLGWAVPRNSVSQVRVQIHRTNGIAS